MLRTSTARTTRCLSKVSLVIPLRSSSVQATSKGHKIPPVGSTINPIDLLLSKSPLGWPVKLSEDLLFLDQTFSTPQETALKPKPHNPIAHLKPTDPKIREIERELLTAINSNDIGPTVRAYVKLRTNDALDKICEADIIKITRVLSNFLEVSPPSSVRTDAEDMAVYFAARGSMDPLNSTMEFYLKKGDVERVYELWHSYVREKKLHSQGFVITKQKSGQDDALLYFAAAASIQDDYRSVVTAVCTSTGNISPRIIEEFAIHHINDPATRQRFRDFLHDAALSRDIRYFKPLSSDVAELGRLSDHDALRVLYFSIKDGLDRGIFVTSSTSSPNEPEPFFPQIIEPKVWSLLIWGAIETRSVSLAEFLIEEMISYGVQPQIGMWNSLLYGYGKQGRISDMMRVIRTLETAGLKPDLRSLSIIMLALFNGRQPREAMRVFEDIQRYPVSLQEEEELLACYNVALNGLLRNRFVAEAHEVLTKMQEDGPKPDIVTFNTFLNRHTNMKDRTGVAETLRAIANTGLKPDIYTFTILYVEASRNKDEQMKLDLLKKMKSLDVKPNTTLFSAAIHFVLSNGDPDSLMIALQLLEKMERDPDWRVQPTEVTYSTIMNAMEQMVEKESLRIEKAYKTITGLYQKMLAKGFRPNRPILHLMMKINLRHPSPESLRIALAIFDETVEDGLDTTDTWYILLQGLERRKEYSLAQERADQLMRSRFEPRGSHL